MKLGKWKIEAIIVAVLICVGLGVWWFVSTKEARQANAQFEELVEFANRQQVEIAIIRQAAELRQLRTELAAKQQKLQNELAAQNQKLQDDLKPK